MLTIWRVVLNEPVYCHLDLFVPKITRVRAQLGAILPVSVFGILVEVVSSEFFHRRYLHPVECGQLV